MGGEQAAVPEAIQAGDARCQLLRHANDTQVSSSPSKHLSPPIHFDLTFSRIPHPDLSGVIAFFSFFSQCALWIRLAS
jgi:hypothetical protein